MSVQHAASVRATLNFAPARGAIGEWSNTDPGRTRQDLLAVEVDIRNARALPKLPTLEREGLTIARHPVEGADWSNNEWIQSVYLPSCEELVRKLTGARRCASIFVPLQRRVDYGEHAGSIPAAQFVHLDNTYESARVWAEPLAASLGESPDESLRRAVIYNVWKPTTPPPQDFPLAVADLRCIPEEDHVEGTVVEEFEDRTIRSPYVALLHSKAQTYYYFPDVDPDESVVFVGLQLDTARKMGCAHSAFRHPAPGAVSEPRRSIESRVLAFFD
jgi:hypothetical protein